MLHAFLEVVNPPTLRNWGEIIPGIHKWETRLGNLSNRYHEEIGNSLKLAIMVGMLPKEYQDMVMRTWLQRKELCNMTR